MRRCPPTLEAERALWQRLTQRLRVLEVPFEAATAADEVPATGAHAEAQNPAGGAG